MKKKIKNLTLEEMLKFRATCRLECNNCPFNITYNYGCSLHDLKSSLSINKLEREVEVDE